MLRVPSGRKYAGSRSKVAFDETDDELDVKENSKAKDTNALGTSVTMVGQSVHDCGSVGLCAHRERIRTLHEKVRHLEETLPM